MDNERLQPLELIEHTLYGMEVDDDVQTLAYALYLLTEDEKLLERFDLGDEDYLAHYQEIQEDIQQLSTGNVILGNQLDNQQEQQPSQFEQQFLNNNQFNQNQINQQNNQFNQHPKRRNEWVDDGSMATADRAIDAKIQRRPYQRDPSKATSQYFQDVKCTRCRQTDYVDTRELRKKQDLPLYANGYVCDGCAARIIKR